MSKKQQNLPSIIGHGGLMLPAVHIDTYNEELRDSEGFVGDHASKGAFRKILDEWRTQLSLQGEDPFGDVRTEDIPKSKLDEYLDASDPVAAGLVHTAVEEFAKALAEVTRRFLALESWEGTERIVVGGGLSGSHIGKLAVGRAGVLLADEGQDVKLSTITNHPDEAGLLGGLYLAPSWILEGYDGILAADIGGTNLRVGIVQVKMKKGAISKATVWKYLHWRHKDEGPTRDGAMEKMAEMANRLLREADDAELKLAPFFAVGCPGLIDNAGAIQKGAQNLPGDWEDESFRLTHEIARRLPRLHGHEPLFIMHNDAVVQGLSECQNMDEVERWGVFTIGTGLGNARFTNRR
jgi:hypothetical protein